MAPKDNSSNEGESPRQQAANDARDNFIQEMNQVFDEILADKANIKPLTYIPAGTRIIVFPNTVHSYASEGDVDVGKFIFSPDTLPELRDVLGSSAPSEPIISNCKDMISLSKEILLSFEKSSEVVKKAYLLLLAGKLLERCRPEAREDFDGDTLGAILDFCQKNYRSSICQKDIAAALHISESYLSHVFSAKMDINFCKYINILRVGEATRLLSESDKSITEIAYECGFSSLRSFNRAFLDCKGVNPRQYRKSRSEIYYF